MENYVRKIVKKSIKGNSKKIDLSNLGLAVFPIDLFELKDLEEIDLSNNCIQEIPKEITKLKNLKKLIIHNNPISNLPVEIVEFGVEAIKNWFISSEELQVNALYESKILVIGDGGVGKTTLARKLSESNASMQSIEESTNGINTSSFEFPIENNVKFKAHIWDFGGAEIYYATHQFYLTKRSLYILVTDSRIEDTNLDYWLSTVHVLGGNSPVIILINEKEDRVKEIDEYKIRNKYNNVKEIQHANLLTGRGFPELLYSIKYHLSQLSHIGHLLPKIWINIRKYLLSLKKNFISYSEYLMICVENNLVDTQRASFLSQYLHDLGVFLHFHDNPILRNTIILNPEWITAAVYKILDSPEIKKKKGQFTQRGLNKLFHDSEYYEFQTEILELMKMFELCYQLPSDNTYIFPQLLPITPSDYKFNVGQSTLLKYQYSIMPKCILTRLIVRMHRYIYDDIIWRNGAVLNRRNSFAEICEISGKNEIQIKINGDKNRELLTIIIEEIDLINSSFKNLKTRKLIPCNCSVCQNESKPTFYEYDSLLTRLDHGKNTIECYLSYENASVKELLGDFGMTRKEGDYIYNSVLEQFGIKPDSLKAIENEK